MSLLEPDSVSVSISAEPEKVWEFISDINKWKEFSTLGKELEQVNETEWVSYTLDGDVRMFPRFDEAQLLIDHRAILADGSEQTMLYRVVPSENGSLLMISTKLQSGISEADYRHQVVWMEEELENIKRMLEA